MKRITKILNTGFVLATFLIVSCNKVMDTKPFDSIDADQAYSSNSTFEGVLSQCYADVLGYYSAQYASMESYTPNGIHSDLNSRDNFPIERGIDATNWDGDQGRFTALRRLNLIIKNAHESSVLSKDSKKQYAAMAQFLRGLMYYDMTRKMGRFIPVNQVFSLADTANLKIPLTPSIAESYKYVMADIDSSISGLPETGLSGKITKYAALGYKSRIALQAYAYTKDGKYLDTAINAANAVINSGNYALSSDYGRLFLFEGKDDKEIILNRQYLSLNSYVHSFNEMIYAIPNVKNDEVRNSGGSPLLKDAKGRSFEGWASYFPTQDLVDQYLVIDNADGRPKAWYETSQYRNNVSEQATNSLTENAFTATPSGGTIGFHKVPETADMGSNAKGAKIVRYGKVMTNARINDIMYNNRDKRFYSTIVYDSSMWLSSELVTLCVQGNLWSGIRQDKSSSWYTTVSNYYWRKAVENIDPRVYYNNKTNYQFVLMRLGEVYMNLAEAYLLKGKIAEAVTALNKTRVAHGGLPVSMATNEDDAWADYIRERRCEMAYEGDLYWSYLRWGKYGGAANYNQPAGGVIQDFNRPVYKIQIKKDRKEFFIGQIVVNDAWDRNFTTKRYLYPIPKSFIDGRAAYGIVDTQNEGW